MSVLICCSCGGRAPGSQWWNRDDGFGICASCFKTWVEKFGLEDSILSCGKPGIHHSLTEEESTMNEIKKTNLIKVKTISEKLLKQIPTRHAPSHPEAVPVGRIEGRIGACAILFQLPNGNIEQLSRSDARELFFKECGSYKTADEHIAELPQVFTT
jgi:hypothetical protein